MTREDPVPEIVIDGYTGPRDRLRPLFELAEDSAVELDSYLGMGRILVAQYRADIVGHLQWVPADRPDTAEIKNMAVLEALHGKRIGARLVHAALADMAAESIRTALVATATAGIGNLRFYQRQGVRFRSVERDAFTPAHGYPPGLLVDGIPLLDRIWLDRPVRLPD